MPHIGEKASRLGHVDVARDNRVIELMDRLHVLAAAPQATTSVRALCRPVGASQRALDDVVAVDGSPFDEQLNGDYPSARVGNIRTSITHVRLDEMRKLKMQQPHDPAAFRRTYHFDGFNILVPFAGVALPGFTVMDTWRLLLFKQYASLQVDPADDASATLLDAIMAIHHGDVELNRCPVPECDGGRIRVPIEGTDCPTCGAPVYPTDCLRTHEGLLPGAQQSPVTQVMSVTERLLMVGYIETLLVRGEYTTLSHTLFMTDGPLALYGSTAPMARRLTDYFAEVGKKLDARCGGSLHMVGQEKTGEWVDHGHGISNIIESGEVMLPTLDYIEGVVGRNQSRNAYGEDTFYGRRFLYRDTDGEMLVLSVLPTPGVRPYTHNPTSEEWNSYPTLPTICRSLDGMKTMRYGEATIPNSLSHRHSSIPRGVGTSVLRRLAQRHVVGLKETYHADSPAGTIR